MNIYINRIEEIETTFDNAALKYIHIRSIKNFIIHLNEILNVNDKKKIQGLLNNYFIELEHQDNILTLNFSWQLYIEYVSKIAIFFHKIGFRPVLRSTSIIPALMIDIIIFLLIIEILDKIYFIPTATLIWLFIYLNQHFRLSKNHKLYGYKY